MDVGSVTAAKRAGQGRKQPASVLSGKSVMFEVQGVAIHETTDGEGDAEGGAQLGMGSEDDEASADPRKQASIGNATTEWVVLSDSERMELNELKKFKKQQRQSPA